MSKRPRTEKQRLEVKGLDLPNDRPIPIWERDTVVRALRRSAPPPEDESKGGRHANYR